MVFSSKGYIFWSTLALDRWPGNQLIPIFWKFWYHAFIQPHTNLHSKSHKWPLMLFRFTVQLDICKRKLYDKISNYLSSDLITTRKTNTIGRWAGRISSSVCEHTKRKRCKGMTSPKPSGTTYSYFLSHINAKKASMFPSSVCCCLCWWKHSFLLERAWRSDL